MQRKIKLAKWSIKVFKSNLIYSQRPQEIDFNQPTLCANDVTDVPAEFVADPFIIEHDSQYYMFFEVYNKISDRGEIGLATSNDGESWCYKRIVLCENHHLSYPYAFKFGNEFYMVPESAEAGAIILYKSKKFPFSWERVCELIPGQYVDPSIFIFNKKVWMFAGTYDGNLHLFYSDHLASKWVEHPKSPIITSNLNISRPAGRIVVNKNNIYRFTQDVSPYYGRLVRSFKINRLSETDYSEEEVSVILNGTNQENDWRKDGMHHIDQLKLMNDEWLIAVDGHKFYYKNYFIWKVIRFIRKPISSIVRFFNNRFKKGISKKIAAIRGD